MFICTLLVLSLAPIDGHAVVDRHGHGVLDKPPRQLQEWDRGRVERTYEEKRTYKDDEILVKFKLGVATSSKERLHRMLGSVTMKDFPSLRLHEVRLRKGTSVEEAINLYQADPGVEYAEPNYLVTIQATPNDPRFDELWGLHNTGQTGGTNDADLDAPEAWNIATGSSSVVVAVIDTGIDYGHADLSANTWVNTAEIAGNGLDDDGNGYVDDVYGINTLLHSGNPWDDHGHGTHVAGIIGAAGNNGIGVVGVNWTVKIMSCKFLNEYGSGEVSGAVACLQYVALMKGRGVNVVATSNSWGGTGYSQALSDAIDAQRETLFIAAAGNSSFNDDTSPFYPASYGIPNLIAVAATNHADGLADFSNYGSSSVHVAAPGESILSTLPAQNFWGILGGYGSLSGTSMATPHVSGLAALIKSQDESRDWRAIKNLILSGGDALSALDHKTITGRRINAHGSLDCSGRTLVSVIRPPLAVEIGTPVALNVLSIRCESSAGPVTVTTSASESLTLLDDGVAPDAAAGDGIFSETWTPVRVPERLDVSSPAGTMTITVPPLYIGHYVPEANTRAPYHQNLAAMGAKPPYTWSLVSGGLPPGLVLNGSTGQIAGMPTAMGTSAFIVRVMDDWGVNMTRTMSLHVDDIEIGEDFARTLHEGSGADGRDIALDGSGNIYVLGNLNGKNYIAKYNASATLLWLESYETGYLRAIALDGAGFIYAAGGTAPWDFGDTLLVKFDPSGNRLWERTYNNGQSTDVAMGIALDGSGNIFLGGVSENGINSMYAQKIDAAGNALWIRTFSRANADYGYAIDVDNSGNAYLGGSSAIAVPMPWGSEYHYDYFIHKYGPLGNLIWTRSYDTGSRYDFLSDLKVDSNGDVYALGDPEEGGYTAFVTMKFTGAGDLSWVRTYQSISHYPAALAVDQQGNVYAAGGSWNEAGHGDWDYLTLKYDGSGNLVWKKVTDGGHYLSEYRGDFAYGLDVDASGSIYVTGTSFNGVDSNDMLMLKYSELGSGGPGEASEAQDMTTERGPGATDVTVRYGPGCGALDHIIAWGSSPMVGGVSWTNVTCGRGSSGVTTFDPGPVSPASFVYFVVVAQDASNEGSYGRGSSGVERAEAVGLGSCDLPRSLAACSAGASP